MIKECDLPQRELLKKILDTGGLNHELTCEIEEALAQPGKYTYEYFASYVQKHDCKTRADFIEGLMACMVADNKSDLAQAVSDYIEEVKDGVLYAKKHHGIIGGK